LAVSARHDAHGTVRVTRAPVSEAPRCLAITIWQPWAALIMAGVKIIETRSWPTRYRGWLAIHAGKRRPDDGLSIGEWQVRQMGGTWRVCSRSNGMVYPLELGAVIGLMRLEECLPMVALGDKDDRPCIVVSPGGLKMHMPALCGQPGRSEVDISGQRPYGYFAPGRFGWVLSGPRPLQAPVSALGRQGLWPWTAGRWCVRPA